MPGQDNTKPRERGTRLGYPFSGQLLQCYIVTMINPWSQHPLSPAAGATSRLILAGVVLGMVWLTVLWALS
jgi:hypothetical protein